MAISLTMAGILSLSSPADAKVVDSVSTLKKFWKSISDIQNVTTEASEAIKTIIQTVSEQIVFLINFYHNYQLYYLNGISKVYELLSTFVLYTPVWIFKNEAFEKMVHIFGVLSVFVISICTVFLILVHMAKGKVLDVGSIFKRLFIALPVSAFSPVLFSYAVEGVNSLSRLIIQIGKSFIQGNLAPVPIFSVESAWVFLVYTLFVAIFIILCIPILLQSGRRWWDVLSLGSLTPLALSAWIFKEYQHFYNKWWRNMKHLLLSQLFFALYVTILGVLMFSFPNPTTWQGQLTKILIMIGGLWRMINIPSFVSSHLDRGDDVVDLYNHTKKRIGKSKKAIVQNKVLQKSKEIILSKGKWLSGLFKK